MTLMADFEAEMAGLDDSTATADKAEWILRTAATIRRSLQNAETRGVAILDRLALEGDGASAEEAMTNDGMSARAAREAADRARAHKKMADAVNDDETRGRDDDDGSDGTEDATHEVPLALPDINPENLDAMRRAEKSLQLPEEQELFGQHRATLTYQAQTLDPTTFKIRLKALVNKIRAQVASTTEDRHRKNSDLKSWIGKNGMRRLRRMGPRAGRRHLGRTRTRNANPRQRRQRI